jgi:hypothetical protein
MYSPLVAQRLNSRISFDSSGLDNYNCSYPGPFWSHTIESCNDKYVGAMPWLQSSNCGWVFNNSDPDYYQYTANMIIDNNDELDTFASRGGPITLRQTQDVIPLLLQFQKFVEVSTTITVQSPVRLLVAVIQQVVDPIMKNAYVELATNLLYPYTISAEVVSGPPGQMGYAISDVSISSECPNSNTSTCTQLFNISITTNGACTITGLYSIQFTLSCQPGVSPCPLPAGSVANVAANIVSEDFCPQISARVTISGTLSSYSSATYTTPDTQFIVDEVTYFEAQISSPQATLTQAKVTTVSIVNNDNANETYLLYSSGELNSAYADSAKFVANTPGTTSSTFYFTLNSSVFLSATSTDTTKSFKVVARVDVQYEGVPGVKRIILDGNLGQQQVAVASNFQLQPSSTSKTTPIVDNLSSSSPSHIWSWAFFVLCVLYKFF